MAEQRDARVKDMEASKVDEKELHEKRTEIDRLKKGEVLDGFKNPVYLGSMPIFCFFLFHKNEAGLFWFHSCFLIFLF